MLDEQGRGQGQGARPNASMSDLRKQGGAPDHRIAELKVPLTVECGDQATHLVDSSEGPGGGAGGHEWGRGAVAMQGVAGN